MVVKGELMQNGVGRVGSIGGIDVGPLDASDNFVHLRAFLEDYLICKRFGTTFR